MKTKLTITASLIFLCSMLFGQGQLPPWLIEWAPDSNYVLLSGPGGIYNHRLLSSLGLGDGSEPDSNLYSVDGSIIDPIRTVNLSGSRLIFTDTGNGHVSINNGREIGLFSIKRNGALDSLVFRFDYGLGTDYGLMLDGPSGQREIFTTSANILGMGAGYTSLLLQATIPTDNTLTTVLAKDPITDQLKEVDISSLGGGNASPCQDTITQASHGFSLGDLVGQTSGGYFPANTNAPDSLPVSFVCSVIDANTFTIGTEGWLDWNHGLSADTDYFLQDNGSLNTSADADYTVFAFRTFGTDKVAFDIPELIVDGSSGGGGSGPNVTASNGLNDADPGSDVDVELGGTLDKSTTVETEGFNLLLGDNTGNDRSYLRTSAGNQVDLYAGDTSSGNESNVSTIETGTVIQTNQGGVSTFTQMDVAGQNFNVTVATSGTTQTQFIQNNTGFTMLGIPAYADDAAAGAAGLITGALYQTTGTAAAPLNVAGILMIKQ